MSRVSLAANGVVKSVVDVLGFHGVPFIRQQTRVVTVPGVGGKPRPMFFGEWTDAWGIKHTSGMADLQAFPVIKAITEVQVGVEKAKFSTSLTHPLWIECKSGNGKQTPEQKLFQAWVESCGMTYLVVDESGQNLMDWLKAKRVTK